MKSAKGDSWLSHRDKLILPNKADVVLPRAKIKLRTKVLFHVWAV